MLSHGNAPPVVVARPAGPFGGVNSRSSDVRHPQVAPLLVVVDQPHARTRGSRSPRPSSCVKRAEEAFDVGLAHEQIERELDDLGLHVRAALRAAALGGLADQRGAKHLRIVRRRFFGW